jgi:hypothetical protein
VVARIDQHLPGRVQLTCVTQKVANKRGLPMMMLRIMTLICLALGLTFQASAQSSIAADPKAQCSTAELRLPDLNALKLPDGEQVIGMLETEYGKMEVRVDVKGGIVSDPKYYIRGKLLTVTPGSKIPKPFLACPAPGKRTSDASILNWIVPSAAAKIRCRFVVSKPHCYDYGEPYPGGFCCAWACCSGYCSAACAEYGR